MVCKAARLTQKMGYDDDGHLLFQCHQLSFDSLGCNWIEGRRRFVTQKHFRLNGESPRQAQTLLLTRG